MRELMEIAHLEHPRAVAADQDTWRFIILGALAALMAIVAPKGLYGLLQQWRPLQFFPVRRRLIGPGVDE